MNPRRRLIFSFSNGSSCRLTAGRPVGDNRHLRVSCEVDDALCGHDPDVLAAAAATARFIDQTKRPADARGVAEKNAAV